MAIYHLSVKPVQRSKGRSATAAAAYRAAERIVDERTGEIHDYRRRGGVDHAEIVGWSGTRSELWNAAEKAERRKDGTPAREYEIALPRELDREQREELAREYAQWLHERHGVAVDVCIHGHDTDNPHAHLLATTRVVDAQGQSLGDKAAVEWSDRKRKQHGMEGRKTELAAARETWQNLANKALERAGQAERIDHRTLEAQRTEALEQGDVERAAKLDREPQNKIGWAAQKMERAGFESDRGREHRERKERNAERQGLYTRLRETVHSMAIDGIEAFKQRYEQVQRGIAAFKERAEKYQERQHEQARRRSRGRDTGMEL